MCAQEDQAPPYQPMMQPWTVAESPSTSCEEVGASPPQASPAKKARLDATSRQAMCEDTDEYNSTLGLGNWNMEDWELEFGDLLG